VGDVEKYDGFFQKAKVLPNFVFFLSHEGLQIGYRLEKKLERGKGGVRETESIGGKRS